MKIHRSDMGRFLPYVRKTWKSNNEVDSQTVVFTFTESGYSIAMAKEGVLLTYLCNRVDFEAREQCFALPFSFLIAYSAGEGMVEIHEAIANGEGYIAAISCEGHVQSERRWPALNAPQYHVLQDLAWHTIDERHFALEVYAQHETISITNH